MLLRNALGGDRSRRIQSLGDALDLYSPVTVYGDPKRSGEEHELSALSGGAICLWLEDAFEGIGSTLSQSVSIRWGKTPVSSATALVIGSRSSVPLTQP